MEVDVAEQHSVDLASTSNQSLGVYFIYILSFMHFCSYCLTTIIAILGNYFLVD